MANDLREITIVRKSVPIREHRSVTLVRADIPNTGKEQSWRDAISENQWKVLRDAALDLSASLGTAELDRRLERLMAELKAPETPEKDTLVDTQTNT